jgi:hypothetical protein
MRSLEQGGERYSREIEIRTELRRWDREYPQIHHELIVRWLAGAVVSMVATSLYNSLFVSRRPPDRFARR